MGKPSTTTHISLWMFRSDRANLAKFKGILAQHYGTTVTTPVAIGEALRAGIAHWKGAESAAAK